MGCVITIDEVEVQPFASVTVKNCVPAVTVNVPKPAYGAVPPFADTNTVPVPPKHSTFEVCTTALVKVVGWLIMTLDTL